MNETSLFLTKLADQWWNEIAQIAWQASLVCLLALCLCRFWRRRSPQFCYWILLIALAKFGIPASLPVSIPETTKSIAVPSVSKSNPENSLPLIPTASPLPSEGHTLFPDRFSNNDHPPMKSTSAIAPMIADWKVAAMLLHILGLAIGSSWFIVQCRKLRYLQKTAKPLESPAALQIVAEISSRARLRHPPKVLVSSACIAPAAVGLFRSNILLPALPKFTDTDLRAIIAHEIAHIKRRDPLVNALQAVIQIGWWFNPLVWMMNKVIRSLREECCDDWLISKCFVEREAYCEALVDIARQIAKSHFPLPAPSFFGSGHPLQERMQRLLSERFKPSGSLTRAQQILAIIIAVVFLPSLRGSNELSQSHEIKSLQNAVFPSPDLAPMEFLSDISKLTQPRYLLSEGPVLNGANLEGILWNDRNLSGAKLCNASLAKSQLQGAILRYAKLCNANLRHADLRGADLTEADLNGADLTGANLEGAKLTRAILSCANLSDANLSGANLDWALLRGTILSDRTQIDKKHRTVISIFASRSSQRQLQNVDLSKCNLDGAFLEAADLRGSNLREASLAHALLKEASMQGAILAGANLVQAQLDRAQLTNSDLAKARLNRVIGKHASFKNALLTDADLTYSDLRHADFSNANMNQTDLRYSKLHFAKIDQAADIEARWILAKDLQQNGGSGRDLRNLRLSEIDLSGVSFRNAQLGGADLSGSLLARADLSGANLSRANLKRTQLGVILDDRTILDAKWKLVNQLVMNSEPVLDLTGADLRHANLSGAKLRGAILERANLEDSILDSVDLTSAKVNGIKLNRARFHNTILPDGTIRSPSC